MAETNVYLVVMDRGGLFGACLEREHADRSAQAIGAVVAEVPIVADYRSPNAADARTPRRWTDQGDVVTTEQATESVRRWVTAFTEAMEAETVPDRTRQRILNLIMFGNPDGDERERFKLEIPQEHAESMRRALEDTGRALNQIINAAGFENLEVRWTDHPEEPAAQTIVRLTWDGHLVTAPAGTSKCAQTVGRPHPADLTHRLFAPDDPGPMVQLLTGCGWRAHRFVTEDEGRPVDCRECLGEEPL